MSNTTQPAPKPAAAPNGGQNGASGIPAGILNRSDLANVLAQMDGEPAADDNDPSTGVANTAPEVAADESPTADNPDNTDLPEAEPVAEGENPEPAEAGESEDLSQSDDSELNEALKGLNADARKHLIEMAQAVEKGETTLGQLKRQLKLGRQENEELQQLREKVKTLESQPPVTSAPPNIPTTVAKLKTVEEVEQRQETAESSIRAIEDFLEENPSGGMIGDREFTRPELIARKRALQDELKVLPKWSAQIVQRQQFSQQQAEARKQIVKDFPVLNDPENPDTKMAREFLKNPLVQSHVAADYMALALARGHRELQAELVKRKATTLTAKPAAKPAGAVPVGKPHAGGTAPARTKVNVPTGELIKGVKDKTSFAELLEATGR